MRILLTLAPLAYPAALTANHHPLAAFIYETVAMADPDLAGFLHEEGWGDGPGKRFKFFVFSVPELPPYRFADGCRWFERGVVRWQISSPLPQFIEALVAGLAVCERVRLGRTEFTVEDVEVVPPPEFTDRMRFIALSPLTVAVSSPESRAKHYCRADEPEFAPLVAENLRQKYRAFTGREPAGAALRFAFDWDYIRQAGGAESRRVTRLIQYKETRIKSYLVPFEVSGDPELIALGWECGFGSANSQGFGMAGV